MMQIYVAIIGSAVKVGISYNPANRVKQLGQQTGWPSNLIMSKEVPYTGASQPCFRELNARRLEQDVISKFSDHRYPLPNDSHLLPGNGEFFRLGVLADIILYISNHPMTFTRLKKGFMLINCGKAQSYDKSLNYVVC
jgi:hypothetical protein